MNFTFSHLRKNLRGCFPSMPVKHKLSDIARSTFDSSQLRKVADRGGVGFQVEGRKYKKSHPRLKFNISYSSVWETLVHLYISVF